MAQGQPLFETEGKLFGLEFEGFDTQPAPFPGKQWTYEIWKAADKKQALLFLRSIASFRIPQLYYIIAETPAGNLGRDCTNPSDIFDEATGEVVDQVALVSEADAQVQPPPPEDNTVAEAPPEPEGERPPTADQELAREAAARAAHAMEELECELPDVEERERELAEAEPSRQPVGCLSLVVLCLVLLGPLVGRLVA